MTPIAQTYPQLALQLSAANWSEGELAMVSSAFEVSTQLFAALERGSGKPFVDHVIGTASGVLLGGGSAEMVAAALLHAAYDQGDFGDGRPGPTPRHRRQLVSAVGAPVEDMVRRYHRLGWDPEIAERAAAHAGATEVDRAVYLIRVANEIDDAVDGGLVLSGKLALREHRPEVHEAVVRLAESVGTPALVAVARQELLGPPPAFPAALLLGGVSSRRRLPSSYRRPMATVVGAVRWASLARRQVARRLVRSTRRTDR